MVTPDVGNTLLRPPRRSGAVQVDLDALYTWVTDLYSAVALEQNTIGSVRALQQTVDVLAARLAIAEGKLRAIGELVALEGPISATYDAQQVADSYTQINAIIARAR
jgi:hypothetical protein